MKDSTFKKLQAERAEAQETLEMINPNHPKAKARMESLREQISDIDGKLQANASRFVLSQIEDSLSEPIGKLIQAEAKKHSDLETDFRLTFRYTVKSGVWQTSISPSVVSRGRKGTQWEYNGTAFPDSLNVNLGKKSDKPIAYKRKGTLTRGTVYKTGQEAVNAVLGCYPELHTAWQKGEKYKAASAMNLLDQMAGLDFHSHFVAIETPDKTEEAASKAEAKAEADKETANA